MTVHTIGAVAGAAGVAVSTVRYYDRLGLLPSLERVGGKRRFGPGAAGRVIFIQRAGDAGFTLAEITEILDDESADWREKVDTKIRELTKRRRQLDDLLETLTEIRACGCEVVARCPLSTPAG